MHWKTDPTTDYPLNSYNRTSDSKYVLHSTILQNLHNHLFLVIRGYLYEKNRLCYTPINQMLRIAEITLIFAYMESFDFCFCHAFLSNIFQPLKLLHALYKKKRPYKAGRNVHVRKDCPSKARYLSMNVEYLFRGKIYSHINETDFGFSMELSLKMRSYLNEVLILPVCFFPYCVIIIE